MLKKYEMTAAAMLCSGYVLHRICAAKDFTTVDGRVIRQGDIGGWIQTETNLSQDDNCWIADNACVYGQASVKEDALVCQNAKVYNFAAIRENAIVCGKSRVYDNAVICGCAKVGDNAVVCKTAMVGGKANIQGNSFIYKDEYVSYDVP